MDNKTWEHTGKGQYVLKDIPYAGYMDGPQKYEKKGKRAPSFIAGFIAGIALVLIIYFAAFRFSNSLSMETQKKIGKLESTIDRYFMGEREAEAEADGIYKGIVSSLGDKYAQYYTVDELTRNREDSAGEFSGIGCTIALDQEVNVCYIASVMEGIRQRRQVFRKEIISWR